MTPVLMNEGNRSEQYPRYKTVAIYLRVLIDGIV